MDSTMLVSAIIARWMPQSTLFWLIILTLGSIYAMVFSVFPYFKCYEMIPKNIRVFGYVGYPIVFVGLLIFALSIRGFIPNLIGTMVYLSVMPFIVVYGVYQFVAIFIMLKQNPLNKRDPNYFKQLRLISITRNMIRFMILVSGPAVTFAVTGSLLQSGIVWEPCTGFEVILVFRQSVASFLMTVNRAMQQNPKENEKLSPSILTSLVTEKSVENLKRSSNVY